MDVLTERTCPECHGTGSVYEPDDCDECGGTGLIARTISDVVADSIEHQRSAFDNTLRHPGMEGYR
jgi:uncharacterized phage protein